MADRAWEQGLHQMIEAKEGCLISDQREPQARISYQRFFSRYLRLAGASGTIREVSNELKKVYGLNVYKVATNQPSKRRMQAERIYRNEALKKQALLDRVGDLYQQRRPVLIGTCSVEESEQVSQWLEQQGLFFEGFVAVNTLGLSGGSVVDGMETNQRQKNYLSDIVHTTNKQIAFDYLRDRIEMGDDTGDLRFQFRQIQRQRQSGSNSQLFLRGLCFALVDEADSVLIDEAKTPLIITKTLPNADSPDETGSVNHRCLRLSSRPHRNGR